MPSAIPSDVPSSEVPTASNVSSDVLSSDVPSASDAPSDAQSSEVAVPYQVQYQVMPKVINVMCKVVRYQCK